jgi:hypothetical protein
MNLMNNTLPSYFKPILWSYSFKDIDPEKDKKPIIVNAINYGDLKHWRWLKKRYQVADVLANISASELRDRSRKLAGLLFGIKKFNHAPRGIR